MRAAFGTNYGISATLPASYWYLRWFDPHAMEPYVDFFGLMTYDLHGPWDAEVKQIGKVVLGQTNIPEIANWTLPLWYDSVDPAKINMGLAYYGRGYTLADPSCNHVGCAWSTQSRPGPCTDFAGVMSLEEIESLIPQVGVQPTLLADDMMKQLTWSNQWIGYDDLETIEMKKEWASGHCFGGTMVWSIDLYSGIGSGDTPDGSGSSDPGSPGSGSGQSGSSDGDSSAVVYIDPIIWTQGGPVINCEPPCVFIFPPLVLPTETTITFPPYITSLDVAWSASTGWTSIVETTTLMIPPVTTTVISAWEYTVTDPNSASTVTSFLYVTSSVLPPPFVITDNPNPETSPGINNPPVTRTITPPPYPYTFTTSSNDDGNPTSTSTGAAVFPIVTYKPGKPGPVCRSGCGKPCLIFCSHPCLLDCPDGGDDFPDPVNPDPPPRPTPPVIDDPLPTGNPGEDTPPSDPGENDPEDPEEEEYDDQCAVEFDLAAPTYDGPIGNPAPTPTVSIAPPPPPPSPSPPPNPSPPSPNPATESLHCYNSGAETGRGDAIKALTSFCNYYQGTVLDATSPHSQHTLAGQYNADCAGLLGCFVYIYVSVTVTHGCKLTIDGATPDHDCGRIIRETIDKCDTSSTRFKQGGKVTSNCAIWTFDPNINW